ncbi:hypothetical protein [Sneathiella glossodoripedis]|uniref:hypothetical protein n=1 Tax=Sneathiella glossodoripedis TaxID=418853 RepID=UPI00046FB360|nr:hypothetical protein [Sneathiella glossodoripedis]
MKGYIYISGTGTDNIAGKFLNDPILNRPYPSLGACMPNIRRLVLRGDRIYVVSGSVTGVQQYIVGGFEVDEKIDAIAAHRRFPENRLCLDENGVLTGNIIVTGNGERHPLDRHDPNDDEKFRSRIQNFIVGRNPIAMETTAEIQSSRQHTISLLQEIFERRGNRVIDIMGRWRKINEDQIRQIDNFLREIKAENRE